MSKNWKILKILDTMSDLQEYQKLSLSQSSGQKGKPEPSEGQNCHGRRAIPLAQASNRLVAREGHCKCMEKPGAQPPTNSGSPHRSSEKTHRPAARQWAPCLNLYQPKGKVFLFLPSDFQEYQKESLSQVAGKTDAEKEPPPGSNFNCWTDQHLQGKAIANTGSFRRDQPPTFLPTSAKRSALSKRRISPPPEKAHTTLSRNVTETTSNFTRKSACIPRGTSAACPDTQWPSTEDRLLHGRPQQAKPHLRRQIFGQYLVTF